MNETRQIYYDIYEYQSVQFSKEYRRETGSSYFQYIQLILHT